MIKKLHKFGEFIEKCEKKYGFYNFNILYVICYNSSIIFLKNIGV